MAKSGKQNLTRGKKAAGDAAAHSGELAQAHQLFSAVCRLDPADAEAWAKLAMVERRLGRLDAAAACAQRALTLAPSIGLTHHVWAVVAHAQDRHPQAIAAYRRALALMPGFVDAHYLLGLALRTVGETGEAVASLRRALQIQPDHAEALGELGSLQLALGDLDQGLALLQRAAAVQPGNVATLCNLAQALRLADRLPEALETARQALIWAPDSADALGIRAALLEGAGRLDEAWACLHSARQLGVQTATLALVESRLEVRRRCFEQAAVPLQRLLAMPGLAAEHRAEAQLLLGRVCDQLNRHEQAMACWTEGKAARQALAASNPANDPAGYLQRVAMLRQLCTPALAQAEPLTPTDGHADPIFLVGFPRSGTTLLEQMLDAHPGLAAMEEKAAVDAMVDAFLQMASDPPAERLAALSKAKAEQLRAVYFSTVARDLTLKPGQQLVDKLPLNCSAAAVIWRVFPRARFILALRHPCDAVLSCFMQDFAINAAMANFHTLAGSARLYATVMSSWLDCAQRLPLQVARIRYEDLIADVQGELQRLMAALQLPWDPAVLDHVAHARGRVSINTPSYQQVVQPIYRSAAGRWRHHEAALRPVLPELAPFIQAFGYADEDTTAVAG